jgi:hypothetical protein
MNVPARYCTGYLGDIGVPRDPAPMDFSAWFEVYLGDSWFTLDARHNQPRIGRILMARGRDATDVAIVTSFGPGKLANFKVITEEEPSALASPLTCDRKVAANVRTIKTPLQRRDAFSMGRPSRFGTVIVSSGALGRRPRASSSP